MAYFISTIQEFAFSSIGNFNNTFKKKSINDGLFNNFENNTKTIFFNKVLKKAFVGLVSNISIINNEVKFDVCIKSIININTVPGNLKNKYGGWYKLSDNDYMQIINKNTNTKVIEKSTIINKVDDKLNILHPPFLKILFNSKNPEEFEDLTYKLIRLIGIHETIQIDRPDSAGRGDGFFKISSLSVIFDCTLRSPFDDFKSEQIINYCNRLNTGNFQYKARSFSTVDTEKQVWIITRGKSRKISVQYNVIVKEVSISDLIKIYTDRINNSYSEIELRNKLSSI